MARITEIIAEALGRTPAATGPRESVLRSRRCHVMGWIDQGTLDAIRRELGKAGLRDTPAFWDYQSLKACGVGNSVGFSPYHFNTALKPNIGLQGRTLALNLRRYEFLQFARSCWKPSLRKNWLKTYLHNRDWHCTWFYLWLAELFAGPIHPALKETEAE